MKFRARIIFVGVLTAAAITIFLTGIWLRSLASRTPERLPIIGKVSEFSLASSGGRFLTLPELRGFVWVADVIDPSEPASFARSLRMADFQAAFERAHSVRLVTFVTGSGDRSAEALSRMASSLNARPRRWDFVAGSPVPAFAGFLVIDREGNIRARIPESKPSASSDVLDTVGDLLRERSGAAVSSPSGPIGRRSGGM